MNNKTNYEYLLSDLSSLNGVGIKTKNLLKKKNINNLFDLLWKLPKSSTDRSLSSKIKDLRVGETVVAIGNPQGLGQSFSIGIVSAINRQFKNKNGSFIQTDASINPGNSGGALVDSKGRLIGITNFIESTSGGSQGLNFAIPVDIVMDSYRAIIN